jgi:hypothetical protein
MTKVIKNEQWSIRYLVSLLDARIIIKPKYQRKKKWDILPKKVKVPNEKDYIDFLYETHNSVHAITFGENNDKTYTNIDGNNRINAIWHFVNRPFELFPDNLKEMNALIDEKILQQDVNKKVKNIFANISYNALMKMKYTSYFEQDLYQTHLKMLRDEFEICIENLQNKLKINGQDYFDSDVKINVNIFQGYSTSELCQVFENINKYNTVLSEDELLASMLYNVSDFRITDKIIESAIKEQLVKLYEFKAENETLNCYQYVLNNEMNAYDFIYGFQNYANAKCEIIGSIHKNKDGASLFYKVYNLMYPCVFTTANVNDFIQKMLQVIDILIVVINELSVEKLIDKTKLFDDCNKKLFTLKKNNVFVLIASILGFLQINTCKTEIQKHISKCILYHFFVKDITIKDKKKNCENYDELTYKAGGGYIEKQAAILYENPHKISLNITDEILQNVLQQLCNENNKALDEKPKKRRKRKFFEKILMYYYYKQSVPVGLLNNTFSMEHIFPFSCKWENHMDIDRLGNIIPIISTLNCKRGNKPISEYKKYDTNFVRYLRDIIPSDETYNNICTQTLINDTDSYNNICCENERKYITNFIDCIQI